MMSEKPKMSDRQRILLSKLAEKDHNFVGKRMLEVDICLALGILDSRSIRNWLNWLLAQNYVKLRDDIRKDTYQITISSIEGDEILKNQQPTLQ